MNESPFESVEEQLLRIFPRLRRTAAALSSIPDDQQPAADGSTAIHLPPPIAASASADAFTCRICHDLASRLVVSKCHEQCVYCLDCFERYLEMRPDSARDRCCTVCLDVPVSRGWYYEDILTSSRLLSRMYRNTKVACPKEGCDWEGPLDHYRRHGASCARRTVLESLGEKLEQTRAELETTRAERDEARLERDEARAERDLLSCKVRRMQEKDDGAAVVAAGDDDDDDDSSDASWE